MDRANMEAKSPPPAMRSWAVSDECCRWYSILFVNREY